MAMIVHALSYRLVSENNYYPYLFPIYLLFSLASLLDSGLPPQERDSERSRSNYYRYVVRPAMNIIKLKQGHWSWVYHQMLQVNSYREKCVNEYQAQGFSRFRWYIPLILGPLWFLGSLTLFYYPGWKSPWVLTVGIWGWCIFFKWQIERERKWCPQTATVMNHNFINIRIIHFSLFFAIPSHLLSIFGIILSPSFREISYLIWIGLWSISVFPAWLHLQLGQRSTPDSNFGLWTLTDSYGDFGNKKIRLREHPGQNNLYTTVFTYIIIFSIVIMIASLLK